MKNILKNKIILYVFAVVIVILIIGLGFFSLKDNNSNEDTAADKPLEEGQYDTSENSLANQLDKISEEQDEGEQILYFSKDDIVKLSITDAHGIVLNFYKDNNQWICEDYEDLDINEDRIDKLLNYLCNIYCVDTIQTTGKEEYVEYGLSQDSPCFSIKDTSGNEIVVSFGNIEEDTGKMYFAFNYDFGVVFVNNGKLHNVGEYTIEDLLQL